MEKSNVNEPIETIQLKKIKKRKKKKSPQASSFKKFLKDGIVPKEKLLTNPSNPKVVVIKKQESMKTEKANKKKPSKKLKSTKKQELVKEPVSEPVKEPISEPISEPVKKPVSEPVSEPVKKPKKKSRVKKIRRSVKRSIKRSRKLDKKHLKNRRVSFRCYSKNKKKIEDVMRSTKTMDQTTLKQKLKEKGIDIKSNQTSLIRDMFIFSELGGIHIKKE